MHTSSRMTAPFLIMLVQSTTQPSTHRAGEPYVDHQTWLTCKQCSQAITYSLCTPWRLVNGNLIALDFHTRVFHQGAVRNAVLQTFLSIGAVLLGNRLMAGRRVLAPLI